MVTPGRATEANKTSQKSKTINDRESVENSQTPDYEAAAESYLEHLLTNGAKEGDSGEDLELPSWYDDRKFRQGQTYMSKYRFLLFSGMLSGLVAVLAIPSILRVLMCTRQSSKPATAYRRYVRTILHTNAWYDYSPTPRTSKFWTSIGAVRHAHLQSSSVSELKSAGKITQKDLALTQFGFVGFITLGAPRIHLYDEEFLECTIHMWRVIGYLMGIKDEYNLCAGSWAETKPRLELAMHRVFAPALDQNTPSFKRMTKALLEGLWPVNSSLTVGSFLFFTRRLAYCKGYEYYESDYLPGRVRDPQQHQYYNDLSRMDRFIVSYGLFLITYCHRYTIVRLYLNFRAWWSMKVLEYLPYLAMWKFKSIKWAYVRIFNRDGGEEPFDLHFHTD